MPDGIQCLARELVPREMSLFGLSLSTNRKSENMSTIRIGDCKSSITELKLPLSDKLHELIKLKDTDSFFRNHETLPR